jgi:hypothetical protein
VQLLSGNGTAPNILGLLNRSGLSTTFAARGNIANALGTNSATADNDMDAIYRMITQIRVNSFIEPDNIVIDPASWQTVVPDQVQPGRVLRGRTVHERRQPEPVGPARHRVRADARGHRGGRQLPGRRPDLPQGRHHRRGDELEQRRLREEPRHDPRGGAPAPR